ncbi:MAG: manganese efflux pump [Clostridiales bacterium]|nr:manganese efflux pump [Clostridiales bacterium]
MWTFSFFFNSILLGVGLAMDAFSVSLANGLNAPCISKKKTALVAGTFAFFQTLMPFLGWVLVSTVLSYFTALSRWIPWMALALLTFIGVKMILDAKQNNGACDPNPAVLSVGMLLVQGVATSIDALSVGLTIASHTLLMAVVSALMIGAVTFGICFMGVELGKRFGTRFAGKANLFGGMILIAIGLEIFLTSIF